MKQLILPFKLLPALNAKDFVVSASNEEAYLWLTRWPNWPNQCLAIYGDKGCGKTHLSHIYQTNTKANYLEAQKFNDISLETLLEASNHFILDDAHLLKRDEKLFHFYNHLLLTKGSLLLLSQTPPAHWKTNLPDLRSRLVSILALKIHPPDEALLSQVIEKLFNDLQLKVEESVIRFLLNHMERSFESAYLWVEMLNGLSLTQKRNITIPLIREILLKENLAVVY